MFGSWSGNSFGATMRSASGGASDAMVVSPTEITKAGRLEVGKKLVGRVIETECNDEMFACYILCGPTRKHLLHVEAWREPARRAKELFPGGKLVSISNVALGIRKAEKAKWSLSGNRMVIRFDKDLEVKVLEELSDERVPGYDNLLVKDIPKGTPRTSLEAAACLREGAIAVRVVLLEIVQRPNTEEVEKSMCKLRVMERREEGPNYEVEILIWGADASSRVASLQVKSIYDICPLTISVGNDKHSFGLRWSRNTTAVWVSEADSCDAAVREQSTVQLSQWKDKGLSRSDYRSQAARLIAASTLLHFVPEKGCQKMSQDELWELPFVTVLDVVNSVESLSLYEGCSQCFKKSCSHSAPKRCCYNVELHICDHTATVEMKVWTAVMDVILKACGVDEPEKGLEDNEKFFETLRRKCWSCRCNIVEESAYGSRPERNRLQMVSIVEQSPKFKGTKRGLFTLIPEHFRPGVPYVFAQELHVDAADQILDESNRPVDMVEMLVMVQGSPSQQGKNTDQGARIVFECVDLGDPTGRSDVFDVMWVVGNRDMLTIARIPDKHIMRIVAQPCVLERKIHKWLVVFYASMPKEDIDAWRARKLWQKLGPEDDARKRAAEEIAACTPKTKVVKTLNYLVSPSDRTSSHECM